MLPPDLTRVEYLGGYRLKLYFSDGASGELNLEEKLRRAKPGTVFEPLRDVEMFKQFRLSEFGETIEWPATGADLAPEFLYELTEKGASRDVPEMQKLTEE